VDRPYRGTCAVQWLGATSWISIPRPASHEETLIRVDLSPLGFDRRVVVDRYKRRISFFLSQPVEAEVPLVLYVQGSGCHSLFRRDGSGRLRGGHQLLLLRAAAERARLLAVEKPGVPFLHHPESGGTSEACPRTFLEQHTLPRWVGALRAALDVSMSSAGTARSPILVVGHSEGAIVAANLAAADPRISHVALLSGSGPTQLYDLLTVTRRRSGTDGGDAAVQTMLSEYDAIRLDPEGVDIVWGHPHRRWTSFLATSTLEELRRSSARIFLAHGTADDTVPIESFDMMCAELHRDGRDITIERIEGADHRLCRPDEMQEVAITRIFERVIDWFVTPPSPGGRHGG
jgi:pimeloyl-ACP methyl ester carboxylesterase